MANRSNGGLRAALKKPAVKRALKVVSAACKCLITIILVGVITASIVGCVLVVYVVTNFDGTTGLPPDLGKLSMGATTTIYTKNKTGEFEKFQQLEGVNSIWADLDTIPLHMQNAVIAIEDKRFRDHYGVDWKRTISAFANLVLHFSSSEYGGSTITQQLIKVTTGENDHSIERKVNEILRAVELERNHASKDQILEAYLNNLPLSSNIVGVGAAANYYFGKDVKDLTIAESAVIASITQNPSKYNPYARPVNNRTRQLTVLSEMNQLGFITNEEYAQACGEELHFKSSMRRSTVQDYYTDYVIEDVIKGLVENYGYTYRFAENMVYYGGLDIYSAENPQEQAAVEAIYANEKNYPKILPKDKENPETALFVVDYSGRVVATIGGRGEKTGNRLLNRATSSKRQPGSSMKPVSAYGPAIAMDLVHYSSVMRDAPITLPGGKKWPPNYGTNKTPDRGDVLLGVALQNSLNTVSARLVEELTPQRCFDFATNTLHLSTLVKSMNTKEGIKSDIDRAPMALGGLTDGVYASEMATAYAVYGGGGMYNPPYSYYSVKRDGEELLKDGPTNVRVLDEDSAYVMTRLLQRVTLYGTAADIGSSWKGWEVFGKTGTTDNEVDVYFVGGTPYYVGASWFGYNYNQPLAPGQRAHAKSLWNKAMKALHNGLEPKAFTAKGTTEEHNYCKATGLLAVAGCPSTEVGVYKKSNIPGPCNAHGGGATTPPPAATTPPSSAPTTAVPTSSTTKAVTTAKPTTAETTNEGID